MFKLVIQDDEGKTTVVPLIRDEITIGRKEGNTIRLTERNVSRRHARIVRANGAVAIEDLGSYNGVRVNGTRIAQRTSLSVSDRVQIGDYLIELKAEGVEQVSDDGKTQPIERMDPTHIEAQLGTAATMPPAAPGQAAVPTAVVALADTDPSARVIPAMPVAPIGAQASGHARIVVLSSNFAGQEWELSRAQMIIGRTDDNDIVINHRSISRNHAKFVREPDTGRYTISDLQSSNGVRVNGEEYGKVELRRGDVVDLGHVRLRFVEPGEDFVFGRDAQIADVPTGSKGKGLMIAAAVVLLGIGAIAIVMLTKGGGGDKKKDNVIVGSNGSDGSSGLTPKATVDAAPTVVATVADAATATVPTDFGKQLGECRAKRDTEDWMGTLTCAKAMQEKSPGNPEVGDLIEQAKRESANKLLLVDLQAAATKGDTQETIRLFKKIPPDSIYSERARAAHDKLRDDFINDEVAKAKQLAGQHKCKDIDKRAVQIGKIWQEAGDAVSAVNCEPPRPSGGNEPECRADNDCSGGKVCSKGSCVAGGGSTPPPSCDAGPLLDEARQAGGANQWSKMLSKAEAAVKCNGGKGARQLALMAACRLGNRDKAMRYWKEFETNTSMKQICIGVTN